MAGAATRTALGGSARRARTASRAGLACAAEAAIVALRRTRATAWQISTALRRAALDRDARVGARRA